MHIYSLKLAALLPILLAPVNCELQRNHKNCGLHKHPRTKTLEQKQRFFQEHFDDKLGKYSRQIDASKKPAKNVVLFIGDGMGIPTITAARTLAGGRSKDKDTCGGDYELTMDSEFEHTALSKVYCTETHTPDSASTATAMATGIKTGFMNLGHPNLSELDQEKSQNIVKVAKAQNKKVGLVTTVEVYHATPAAFYAHAHNRYDYKSVFSQFATNLKQGNIDLALGGGNKYSNRTKYYEEAKKKDNFGDFKVLEPFVHRPNLTDIKNLKKYDDGKPIVGLFDENSFPYIDERKSDQHPNLVEMTEFALKNLDNEEGMFLMVEGGRIDQAHHDNQAMRALEETLEFDRAIKKAIDFFADKGELDETLIIVTADHSHQFTLGSYIPRNLTITSGLLDEEMLHFMKRNGGLEYWASVEDNTTRILPMNYATGPAGDLYKNEDFNMTKKVLAGYYEKTAEAVFPSLVKTKTAGHGGEDVAIFARGPWSFLFSGAVEQTSIFYTMKQALTKAAPISNFAVSNTVDRFGDKFSKLGNDIDKVTSEESNQSSITELNVCYLVMALQWIVIIVITIKLVKFSRLLKHREENSQPSSDESFPLNEKV